MSASRLASRSRVQALLRSGGEMAAAGTRGVPQAALVRVVAVAMPRFFDPEAARDLDAVIEMRITGAGAPATLTLRIDHGTLTVTPGSVAEPGAAMEIPSEDMVRLVTGGVGWPQLVSEGRMALSGDPFLAMRIPVLFRLPAG